MYNGQWIWTPFVFRWSHRFIMNWLFRTYISIWFWSRLFTWSEISIKFSIVFLFRVSITISICMTFSVLLAFSARWKMTCTISPYRWPRSWNKIWTLLPVFGPNRFLFQRYLSLVWVVTKLFLFGLFLLSSFTIGLVSVTRSSFMSNEWSRDWLLMWSRDSVLSRFVSRDRS